MYYLYPIEIIELPPKFVKPLTDKHGVENECTDFECELSKAKWKKTGQDIVIKWFKGERELRDTIKYSIKRDDVKHSLTIRDLAFEDVSEYTAMVSDEKTSAKLIIDGKLLLFIFYFIYLFIFSKSYYFYDPKEGKVKFVSKLKDIEVSEKETATFEAELSKITLSSSGQQLNVEWFKKNDSGSEVKLDEKDKFHMVKIGKKLILKVKDANLDDSGIYVLSVGGEKVQARLTVNEIPITFKKPLEDQRAKEDQSAVFECTVNRSDKPVKWFVNGKPISNSDKYAITQDKNRLQLTIKNLTLDDDNCEVTCQVGDKAKTNARLKVEEDEIKFIEKLADLGVRENDAAQFTCKLSKLQYKNRPNQTINIKWFVNGKEVVDDKAPEARYKIENISTTLKLTIPAVHAEDAGEIKCLVNDTIYTAANLSVEEEPVVFVKKLNDVTTNELNGKVTFACELNKPFVKAKWYKSGKEISSDDPKYDFGREGCKHFLHIKNLNAKDVGDYTIVLQEKSEKKSTGTLTIQAGPKIFLNAKYNDTITLKKGKPLLIEIDFSAYPEPKTSWMVNDEPLKESTRTKIETVRNNLTTLLVNKTERSDSGKYHMTLENDYGREKCTINVNVLDRPSPPRNPQVVSVSGTLKFFKNLSKS